MKKLTKKYIILILLIFIIITFTFCIYLNKDFFYNNYYLYSSNKYVQTSKRSSFIIKNVDDTLLNNYVSKKENTLIVFWASWCQACVDEANELNNFINNNPEVSVIVVSFDKNITDLENYFQDKKYNWFVIFDPERKTRLSIDTDVKGIPATYLINKNLDVISKDISSKTEKDFFDFYYFNE